VQRGSVIAACHARLIQCFTGNDYEHSSDDGTDCRCLLLAHREFLSSKNLI